MIAIVEDPSDENIEIIRTLFREYEESFRDEPTFRDCLSVQNFAVELADLPGKYAPPYGGLLLATYSGDAAGCVALKKIDHGICEMKRLYVRKGFRRLQLGHRLVMAIIGMARTLGYHKMRLDTLPMMTKAMSLYARFGFHEIERYNENPATDAVYMELDLLVSDKSN